MLTIHKYEVPASDTFEVDLPSGAEFLSVQEQNGRPQMWLRVNTNDHHVRVRFFLFGTGQRIPPQHAELKFLGTFQLNGGMLVFHLFCEEKL